jgi:amino acid transporter
MIDPPTLTFMDLIQSLIYLPLGLVVLALSTTLSGLGAVGGVNARDLSPADVPVTTSSDLGASSTAPITVDVTTTLINTLRSAIDRRVRLLINNFALSLRQVGWPSLIFAATYGIAELSSNIFRYLHSPRAAHDALTYIAPAAGWGLLAIFGVVLSAALIVYRLRVAENTLRFLGLVGFVVLLTFWIFSLALFGFNKLLTLTNASDKHPFDPPSAPTYLSIAALVIFGALLFIRRARGPRLAAQAVSQATVAPRQPAAVTANIPASPGADPSATQAGSAEPPTP